MSAIEVGPLRILPGKNWMYVSGKRIRLSTKQRRLIVHLGWCAKGYVTRRALNASVGYGLVGDECRYVDVLVSRVRKKLRDVCGENLIHPVRGDGYALYV